MDKEIMKKLINLVLIPLTKMPLIIQILVLDAYHVHMMGIIVHIIQSFDIQVIHISGGYMYLCQPVDIGINTSIKSGVQKMGGLDVEG